MGNNKITSTSAWLRLMFHSKLTYFYIVLLYIPHLLVHKASIAQVIPSSNTNTSINVQQVNGTKINRINGGISQGINLFHEFREFNLDQNNSVSFISPSSIENILATVQSGRTSRINSTIGVEGSANLFLFNKNGFIFGPNSSLQLQGSFLASTANKLIFSDGFEYYTNQKNQSISTEGQLLKFSHVFDSGSIKIFDDGHKLEFRSLPGVIKTTSILSGAGNNQNGISIDKSRSIAFIGNGIEFNGGIINAPSGDIFISSIKKGIIEFRLSNSKFSFNTFQQNENNNINVLNKSILDNSGQSSGNITVIGEDISIRNASFILSESINNRLSSHIDVQANNTLLIEGTSDPSLFFPNNISSNTQSSIFSQNLFGKGTNINIKGKNIILNNGGSIEAFALFSGETGDIYIEAFNLLNIQGESPLEPVQSQSSIITSGFNSARGGKFVVNTRNLNIDKGGSLSSISFSNQPSSNLKINVKDTLSIQDFSPTTLQPSLISSLAFANGAAGDITINAKFINIRNSGVISTSTFNSANSGNLQVFTSKLFIDGKDNRENISLLSLTPTGIVASAPIAPPFSQEIFFLPPFPTGDAGSLSITAKEIQIKNRGVIAVANQGLGNAGLAVVNSDRLSISNLGSIAASTVFGNGGNINIKANQVALDNGILTTSALGNGTGGNISINTDLFVSFSKSIISANAVNDKGGNITFNTTGFLSSTDTEITATSALGEQFDGTITFSNPDRDLGFTNTLVEAKPQESEISSVCNPKSNSVSEFFMRGDGGLPMGATDQLTSASGWHDPSGGSMQPDDTTVYTPEIVHVDDAQGMVINPDGTGSLVSYSNLPINKAEKPNNCNAKISPDHPTATHTQPNRTSPNSTLSARPNTTQTATAKAPTHSSATTTP